MIYPISGERGFHMRRLVMDKFRNKAGMVLVVVGLLIAGRGMAGSLDPANPTGPTMHTLEESYQKQMDTDQKIGTLVIPQTLSATTVDVQGGYYAATNLIQVEPNLVAGNIKTNVTIFGIAGSLRTNADGIAYSSVVPKTGQTNSYRVGDDGTYMKGVGTSPRFTIGTGVDETNCVTDNLTGLIWTRNANMAGGLMNWTNAVAFCESLTYGGHSDWRLPNVKELQSLIDFGRFTPALCNTAGTGKWTANDPFIDVRADGYNSSTTDILSPTYAWMVSLDVGYMSHALKTAQYYVWPVRGGQ